MHTDMEYNKLYARAEEIFEKYKDLPLQAKIDVIAQTFGYKTGEIHTSLCTGKWRGTSDMSIHFDSGVTFFLGNGITPKTKTMKLRKEYIDCALFRYNPEIVKLTKEVALSALLLREAEDDKIAAEKGLDPYKILTVEMCNGDNTCGHVGWYYVTLAINGKIRVHLETGLNHNIANGRVYESRRNNYFVAGALNEEDVDYVFNNVGFSTESSLYTLPLLEDVRKRAERVLVERTT